jgi:hypothetical protein
MHPVDNVGCHFPAARNPGFPSPCRVFPRHGSDCEGMYSAVSRRAGNCAELLPGNAATRCTWTASHRTNTDTEMLE